jgi:MFS family permease
MVRPTGNGATAEGGATAGREAAAGAAAGTAVVLTTLAAGQFLMALDSSVMNVSIATVAEDIGTTVTGIQTAITFYTLVMACLMITGGKVGEIIGRKRAFSIGCVIYGSGSLTTSLAPSLPVLLLGWSVLEGVGAALIMPAIVALVAANFDRAGRPRAYGLVAAAGAVAVAAGPLVGGFFTTYGSWRWVFAGEALIVMGILVLARRIADLPPEKGVRLDLVGAGLSALGLGLVVFGVLRAGEWGFVNPKPGAPTVAGLSPVPWLVLAGGAVLLGFLAWERRRTERDEAALLDPRMLANRVLRGGLTAFFFQYTVLAGTFFAVPLFLSVALGLSAIETGLHILPLSLTLLAAAVGVPRFLPAASPRRVVRVGFLAMLLGLVLLVALLEVGAGPEVVTSPLMLVGLGIGSLASQLGAVTVSAVDDDQSASVGGLQNTVSFLGSSIGTALAGALLISALTTSFLTGVQSNPAVPSQLSSQAAVQLAGGVPFVSDAQLETALSDAGVSEEASRAIVAENADARVAGLRTALAAMALLALVALFLTGAVPDHPATDPSREAGSGRAVGGRP